MIALECSYGRLPLDYYWEQYENIALVKVTKVTITGVASNDPTHKFGMAWAAVVKNFKGKLQDSAEIYIESSSCLGGSIGEVGSEYVVFLYAGQLVVDVFENPKFSTTEVNNYLNQIQEQIRVQKFKKIGIIVLGVVVVGASLGAIIFIRRKNKISHA